MSAKLSTHVLDLHSGKPAEGVRIELWRVNPEARLLETQTNADGRTGAPLLIGETLPAGTYELRFHVGAYFIERGIAQPETLFLDIVPVRFHLRDPQSSYHVPLLVTPWAYSTYRGS